MKYHILLGFFAVVTAYPGIIHEEAPHEAKYDHQALIGESGHHHQVEHQHAKSHQSIKFEHFHPVPVYVKKEHSHLLKHPLEKGKSEQNLKLIHPETEHTHGGGLVLEDDRHNIEHHAGGGFGHDSHEHAGFEHAGLEHGLGHGGLEQGGLEHGHVEQGSYQHGGHDLSGYGGYEGGEGLKAYAELQHPEVSHYIAEHGQGDSGEGYKYDNY